MARSVEVPLSVDDFQTVSDRIPYIADLKPSGQYVMEDVHRIGGTPAVMKYLMDEGLITGDCMTVTGRTVAENLAECAGLAEGQPIVRPLAEPINPRGLSGSSGGISLPAAQWRRSPARRGSGSRAPPGSSIPRRTCWPLSRKVGSGRATSS